MKRRTVIFAGVWFFALGIVVASFLPRSLMFFGAYYFFSGGLFFFLAAWLWKNKITTLKIAQGRRAALIWAAFLFFGAWRFAACLPVDSPDKIWHYNGKKIELVGLVSSESVFKGRSQKLEIKSLAINFSVSSDAAAPRGGDFSEIKDAQSVSGKVLAVAAAYPRYNYGDILKLTCRLERPEKIEDFDYEKYLAARGFYSVCSFPKISVLEDGVLPPLILAEKKSFSRGAWLLGAILDVRKKLSAVIDAGPAEPEAGLLKAFILNDPTIPDDLNVFFRQSGLSHIVAISGSHISLVIALVFFLLLFAGLNRRHTFWICAPIILFYVALAGAPASAVRAGIMGFLVLLAMYFGRLSRLDYILVLAGLAMLLFNPMLIIADAGFQLSFLAVLGMIYLYPIFDRRLERLYKDRPKIIKLICQTAALTVAAQVFTAPILIFSFHQISLIAPLANLLVLWTAPLIMIAAFIAMGLTLIIPSGALIFFIPADFLLKYLIAVAEVSAKIPFAYWKF